MKKILLISTASVMLAMSINADLFSLFGDDDEHEYKNKSYQKNYKLPTNNTPEYKLYMNECSSCHMGYQAEFLPKRSWVKMMQGLDDHFGVDATVEKEDYEKILNYLISNSSDSKATSGYYSKLSRSIPTSSTPIRISEIPKFVREHRELSKKMITQKEVKSIANCNACHTQAENGIYSERSINIPNYGRWDD